MRTPSSQGLGGSLKLTIGLAVAFIAVMSLMVFGATQTFAGGGDNPLETAWDESDSQCHYGCSTVYRFNDVIDEINDYLGEDEIQDVSLDGLYLGGQIEEVFEEFGVDFNGGYDGYSDTHLDREISCALDDLWEAIQ